MEGKGVMRLRRVGNSTACTLCLPDVTTNSCALLCTVTRTEQEGSCYVLGLQRVLPLGCSPHPAGHMQFLMLCQRFLSIGGQHALSCTARGEGDTCHHVMTAIVD